MILVQQIRLKFDNLKQMLINIQGTKSGNAKLNIWLLKIKKVLTCKREQEIFKIAIRKHILAINMKFFEKRILAIVGNLIVVIIVQAKINY